MTLTTQEQLTSDAPAVDARAAKRDQQGTASVLKALHLLEVFRGGAPAMGVSEIARQAGVPVSTAYRLLAYLVESGFVTKEGTSYRPGDKLFELGNQVAHSRPQGLRERVAPYLGELYMTTGLTVRLGVLDGPEVVIVDKIVGLRTLPAPTAIGGRVPASCTALGKALLAHQPPEVVQEVLASPLRRTTRHSITAPGRLHRQLQEVRSTRLAFDREESILGQVCIATPLLRDGSAVAAISVSSPCRVNSARAGEALLRTARQIQAKVRL
jgi:DNA-binding IclR family transcriptional regulator